jgi:hypothetical protein
MYVKDQPVMVVMEHGQETANVVESSGRTVKVRFGDGSEAIVSALSVRPMGRPEGGSAREPARNERVLIDLFGDGQELPGVMITPDEMPGYHRVRLDTGQAGLMATDRVRPAVTVLYLWKLANREDPEDFDEMRECVVIAPDEKTARKIAARSHGTEDAPQWLREGWSSCARLGLADDRADLAAGLVMSNFRHGHKFGFGSGCDYPDR